MLWQFHRQDLFLLLQWFIDWYFALPNKHTALTFSFGSDTEPTLSIIWDVLVCPQRSSHGAQCNWNTRTHWKNPHTNDKTRPLALTGHSFIFHWIHQSRFSLCAFQLANQNNTPDNQIDNRKSTKTSKWGLYQNHRLSYCLKDLWLNLHSCRGWLI